MKPSSSSRIAFIVCALALAACTPKREPVEEKLAPSTAADSARAAPSVDGGRAPTRGAFAMRASTANPHLERTALPIGGLAQKPLAANPLGLDDGARDDACVAACRHLFEVERANQTGAREVRDTFPERVRGEYQEMLLVSTGGVSPSHCGRRCVAGTFDPTCASKIEKLSALAACVRGPLFPEGAGEPP